MYRAVGREQRWLLGERKERGSWAAMGDKRANQIGRGRALFTSTALYGKTLGHAIIQPRLQEITEWCYSARTTLMGRVNENRL